MIVKIEEGLFFDDPWSADPKPEKGRKVEPLPTTKGRKKRAVSSSSGGNPVDDLIDKVMSTFKGGGSGGNHRDAGGNGNGPTFPSLPKGVFYLILPLVLCLWLMTGFYRVEEGEVAVILRFGEILKITSPGLHYRLPFPIEEEIVRRVSVLNKIDGGTHSRGLAAEDQSLILTGDENMVHTNYTVLWKVKDVAEFLFTARDPEGTIQVAAESAIREVLGQTTARLALTEGREVIGTEAQELLQKILDMYKIGVQIVSVQLQRVEPPAQVIQAFNDMQASLVDADRLRNEAEAYRNDILPRARGEAEKITQEAEAYREQVVAHAEGEAARFNSILAAYKINPAVTLQRYYFDTLQKVLSQTPKTVVDAKVSPGIVPYFHLQPPVQKENTKKETQ